MKKLIYHFCLLLLVSCDREKNFEGPDFYSDDFESYSTATELITDADSNWSLNQLTDAGNFYSLDTVFPHSGNQCMKFTAVASNPDLVSKCSIMKQNMAFWEGETVYISVWYYLASTDTLQWLFLTDLEEQAAIGAGPGMRIALVDNQLRIEHKFNERDIVQPEATAVDFPRNQWVHLEWEVKLSQKHEGSTRVWQDGTLIIDADNRRTLPEDLLYFQQGTRSMYSSIEIGITANSRDSATVLYADDFEIRVQ